MNAELNGEPGPALSRRLVEDIAGGAPLDPAALLESLGAPGVAQRARANAELAAALFAAGRAREAGSFAERAWQQSAHAEQFLPLYVEIRQALGDAEGVRSACRRTGICLAESGRTAEAMALFNQSHYAYERAGQGDRYEFDFEIMRVVDALARDLQPLPAAPVERARDGRLRIAYLVYGAAHQGSVLVKLLSHFAKHHDRERFDVRFYVPESPDVPRHAPFAGYLRANIAQLESNGAAVESAKGRDEFECWLGTSRGICAFGADVLVTTALLADYSHYFIAALRPAPAIVGLGLGPPAQFAAPGLDWVVCATRHPMMDMPCEASVVEFETDAPDPSALSPRPRATLGIPADAPIVVVAGRAHKFLDRGYWQALGELLAENPQAWLLVLGLAEPPPFLDAVFAPGARARFRQTGWSGDYLELLALADVVIDTYPSGGGFVLTDAMALGIPVACFRNDYLHVFDQTDWAPAEEFVGEAELIAPRGDFAALRRIVGGLIADPRRRRELGARCRDWLQANRGQPARMVRRHEEIYARVSAQAVGRVREPGLALASDAAQRALEGRGAWNRAETAARPSPMRRLLRRAKRLLAG